MELKRGPSFAEREDKELCTPAGQIIPRKRGVASPLPADWASPSKRRDNRCDAVVCEHVCTIVCVCVRACVHVCVYMCLCVCVCMSLLVFLCCSHTATSRPNNVVMATMSSMQYCL